MLLAGVEYGWLSRCVACWTYEEELEGDRGDERDAVSSLCDV